MSGRVRSVPARCGAVRSVAVRCGAVRCVPFWQEAAPVVGWRWWRWCSRRWWLACVASCPGAEDGVGDAARARVPAVPAGASPEMERSRSAAVWGSSVAWHVGGPALRLSGAVAVGNLGGVALQRRRISFFPAFRSLPAAVGCPVGNGNMKGSPVAVRKGTPSRAPRRARGDTGEGESRGPSAPRHCDRTRCFTCPGLPCRVRPSPWRP
jgi:hypothetical protein